MANGFLGGLGSVFSAFGDPQGFEKQRLREAQAEQQRQALSSLQNSIANQTNPPAFLANELSQQGVFDPQGVVDRGHRADTLSALASFDPKAAASAALAPPVIPKPFSSIGKIQSDVSRGFISPGQGQKRIDKLSSPSAPLIQQIGKEESAFQKAQGKTASAVLSKDPIIGRTVLSESAKSARKASSSLKSIRVLMGKLDKADFGTGSKFRNDVFKAFDSVSLFLGGQGIGQEKLKRISSKENLIALANELSASIISDYGSGNALSDKDAQLALSRVVSISQTEQGAGLRLELMEETTKKAISRSRFRNSLSTEVSKLKGEGRQFTPQEQVSFIQDGMDKFDDDEALKFEQFLDNLTGRDVPATSTSTTREEQTSNIALPAQGGIVRRRFNVETGQIE